MKRIVFTLLALIVLGSSLWISLSKRVRQQIGGLFQSTDEKAWQEARDKDTVDSYITYLLANPGGEHEAEARDAAKTFLTIKFHPLGAGQFLVTDGWGKGWSLHADTRFRTIEKIREEGTEWVFVNAPSLKLKGSNTVFEPRINCPTILVYREPGRGVRVSGFDIYVQGSKQIAPVVRLTIQQVGLLMSQQGNLSQDCQ